MKHILLFFFFFLLSERALRTNKANLPGQTASWKKAASDLLGPRFHIRRGKGFSLSGSYSDIAMDTVWKQKQIWSISQDEFLFSLFFCETSLNSLQVHSTVMGGNWELPLHTSGVLSCSYSCVLTGSGHSTPSELPVETQSTKNALAICTFMLTFPSGELLHLLTQLLHYFASLCIVHSLCFWFCRGTIFRFPSASNLSLQFLLLLPADFWQLGQIWLPT